MKKANVLNKRLEKISIKRENLYLFSKIKTIKPSINMKCPESYIFYKMSFHSCRTQPNGSMQSTIYNIYN